MKSNTPWFTILILLAGSLTQLTARDIDFVTYPSGATLTITNLGDTRMRGGSVYTTPTEVDFSRRSEPYRIAIAKPGYQTLQFIYDYYENDERRFSFDLVEIEKTRTFTFNSTPTGASVMLDNRSIGTTPLQSQVTFRRSGATQPWSRPRVSFSLPNHQSITRQLSVDDGSSNVNAGLTLINKDLSIEITAKTDLGDKLEAYVTINGENVGTTPLSYTFDFKRSGSNADWNSYTVAVEIPEEYKKVSKVITYPGEGDLNFKLEAVTELPVKRYMPVTEFAPRGARMKIDETAYLATYDVRDLSSPAVDLRPITEFKRDQNILQSLNSFCLTPDGQNVIYSATMATEEGNHYSNLFTTRATDASSAFSQLTRGSRFFDTKPRMSREEGSTVVVFQSNRGPIESWDISSFKLRDGRVVGGIVQLTREQRFNYNPFITSEQQPIFFLSVETYPMAEPFISFVNLDGSSYTNLGETGQDLFRAEVGTIYFVRKDEVNGKKSIFSITSEGLAYSTVINDYEFSQSNCFNPALSPDGTKLLFVSDYAQDEEGRNNNNIFLLDIETGRIQQLTDNASDDIAPEWSPTEPSVLYFMSNRGLAYNVWRMVLVD